MVTFVWIIFKALKYYYTFIVYLVNNSLDFFLFRSTQLNPFLLHSVLKSNFENCCIEFQINFCRFLTHIKCINILNFCTAILKIPFTFLCQFNLSFLNHLKIHVFIDIETFQSCVHLFFCHSERSNKNV